MQLSDSIRNLYSPFAPYSPYLFAAFIGFTISDLAILKVRAHLFPTAMPQLARPMGLSSLRPDRSAYGSITARNMVSQNIEIPPELRADESGTGNEQQVPILSQLPLTLIGTIVHGNPLRSIGTIELKSQNSIQPFIAGDEIEGMARIEKIERKMVIFTNLSNGRREYIEIPSDFKINFKSSSNSAVTSPQSSEYQVSETQFALKRSDVLKYTADMGSLLQQARAVPNRDPRTGEIDGFRIMNIKPDSIFTKLGVKQNDVISGVNGEPVTTPQKAMELYQKLRTESKIEVTVKRGGQDVRLEFNVNE